MTFVLELILNSSAKLYLLGNIREVCSYKCSCDLMRHNDYTRINPFGSKANNIYIKISKSLQNGIKCNSTFVYEISSDYCM